MTENWSGEILILIYLIIKEQEKEREKNKSKRDYENNMGMNQLTITFSFFTSYFNPLFLKLKAIDNINFQSTTGSGIYTISKVTKKSFSEYSLRQLLKNTYH